MKRRKDGNNLFEILRGSVALEEHAPLSFKSASEKHLELLEFLALGGILPALLVRDEASGRGENGIDNAQVVRTKRASRLGKIYDSVDELRCFDFRRAPAEFDICLDIVLFEIALYQTNGLGGNTLAVEILDRFDLGIVRDGEHPTHRIRGGFRVIELADFLDIAAVFINPVVSADTGVEKTQFYITAHFLRSQETALDLFVVDRRHIRTAGAGDIEARSLEKSERRIL